MEVAMEEMPEAFARVHMYVFSLFLKFIIIN
jgi:hypothetical protein